MQDKTNIVRVGVSVLLRNGPHILLGKRIGSHGEGTWAFPCGHMEFGETPQECAAREMREETGLVIKHFELGPYTNDRFVREDKHYITLYAYAAYLGGDIKIMEPDRCLEWRWFDWSKLPPRNELFLPVQNFLLSGYPAFGNH